MRNEARADEAAASMTGDVEVRSLDLLNLASVRAFADGVDSVDVLVTVSSGMHSSLARDDTKAAGLWALPESSPTPNSAFDLGMSSGGGYPGC